MSNSPISFSRRTRRLIVALPLAVGLSAAGYAQTAPGEANPTTASPNVTAGPTGPAAASDGPAAQQDAGAGSQEVVVTGSRIARPTLDSPIPVTTLSASDLSKTGQINIGDALSRLPALSTSFNQAGSTNYIGTSGLNILDLRSLGQSRTLVLVDGRRHITAQEGEFLVDVNTIPNDLIDRVDVVTGGSSAVYGSDAMAGVVNFVLKKDFDGFRLNAQSGITTLGDKGTLKLSGTAGRNFAEGRGNISVALEYDQSRLVTYADRDSLTGAFSGRNQFQQIESPAIDNTTPDRTFLPGIRSYGYAAGGNFIAYTGGNIRSCAEGVDAACLPNGFPRVFQFAQDGSLNEINYGRDFRPAGSGNNQGGDGSTLNEKGTLQPAYKRYVANILGHYDVSDAFRPYFEAKFVRVNSFNQGSGTFSQGGGQGADEESYNDLTVTPIQLDNAFLTPQARDLIQSLLPAGSTFFTLNRNSNDLGTRDERDRRDTWRVVGGVQGTFNDDWKYDVAVNYGHLKTRSTFYNNRLEENFYNAIDAVRNASGQIVCRVNQTTVTDPACAPLDLLGEYATAQLPSERAAALAYAFTTSHRHGRASELDISANVTGDSSQIFELPGGPVRFSLGGEYRREKASYAYDAVVSSGKTFLNAIPDFNPPSFAVKEAFGEIEVPILRDRPFFEELTINGAARYSKYKGSAGSVWAYNGGAFYAPVRDIRFRVNYSKSVRAPTLGDLYSSNSINYAGVDDPCDVNFIDKGSGTRAANCAAAGVPAGFENAVTRSSTLQILSGGNPDLGIEKSRSWTYGVILQPRFVPGLSITADYYDIKIRSVIASVDAQDILNGCYDAADLNNSFCNLIFPRGADGNFQQPALLQSSLNFSAERAKGIDVDVAYNHNFDGDNRLVLRFIGTYNRFRTDYPYVDDPTRPQRLKGTLGQPRYQFNASADYTYKTVTLGYTLRYIGRQSITDYETQHEVSGLEGTPYDPNYADRVNYPRVLYHDVRATVQANRRFSIYGGIDNLSDRKPPLGLFGNGNGYNTYDTIYDNIGRFAYLGVRIAL